MVLDKVDFRLIHFQAAVAHRLSRDLIRHFHQTGHFWMIWFMTFWNNRCSTPRQSLSCLDHLTIYFFLVLVAFLEYSIVDTQTAANGLEHIICCICNSQIIPSAGGVISLSLSDIKTFGYWFFFVSRICFIFNLSFNFRCIEPTTFDKLNRSTCCLIWTNTLLCDIKLALLIYKQLIAIDES